MLVAVPAIAFLMEQYCEDTWLGCVLTFLTVTALSGVHEVARELENPFRNVPNEIPLATFMAESNEALLTMYAGYHPDFFWADAAKQYPPPAAEAGDDEPMKVPPKQTGNGCKFAPGKDEELEDRINQLMIKIEEQGKEIDLLRSKNEMASGKATT